MKMRVRLPLIMLIILVAIFTIAWIKYPNSDFIKVKIPQIQSNVPVISTLSGRIISIDNNKIVLHSFKGDIDIYNYRTINNIICIRPKKYITFLVQTQVSYSGEKESFIIGVVTQGEKIFFNKPLMYHKHCGFINHLIPQHSINSFLKEASILLKNLKI